MIRVSGAVLNCGKGAIVLMLLLTFLLSLSDTIYTETDTTKLFTGIGSKVMTLYNRSVDEQQIVPNAEAIIEESKDLIDDDFRQNLLER